MGWFSKKSESLPADDVLDALNAAKTNKQRREILSDVKKGKYGLSPKELKALTKQENRAFEGEKGMQAMRAAMKDFTGARGKELASKQYEQDLRAGKHHARERLRAVDPKRYEAILHEEAKRQGLI